MGDDLLTIEDLSVSFTTEDGVVQAVSDVGLVVKRREVLAIVGESGSGKSVTALAIMRLHPKGTRVSGSIRLGDRDLLTLGEKEMRTVRGRDVAMIFQDPMTALNPVITVGAQLVEMILAHQALGKGAAMKRAAELLEVVGVPEPQRRVDQYPHEFSGGMRQRAMIAMAIANEPKLLIADEPTTALDVTIQAQVMEVLKAAQEATGAAILLITHDLGLVAGIADRVHVMYAGRIFERGTTDQIFYDSANPYTRGLMSSIPRLDERGRDRLIPIPGSPPSLMNLPSGCAFRPRCPNRQAICEERAAELTVMDSTGHESRCHEARNLPPLELAHG